MKTVTAVVVGAGHAGLAMSHHLARHGIDHVILERGEVANAWRRQRWDSLRLLTPNWQTRLPGQIYTGPEPEGFMGMAELIAFLDDYARGLSAPLHTGTEVISVRQAEDGYRVMTDRGEWRCRAVVIATGACQRAAVPALAADLPPWIASLTPLDYRNPDQLAPGGVLVVGASATGVQLADELQRSGRPVTLAVGEHLRLPRRYRSRDIQWWLEHAGLLDQRFDEVEDLIRARRQPSPQLLGSTEPLDLDLNALSERGVRLVGRLVGLAGTRLQFSGSLAVHCQAADLKLVRLLDNLDDWASAHGWHDSLPVPERPAPTRVPQRPCLGLDLAAGEIKTVLWATGFRPDYRWLEVPVFDDRGRLLHHGGVVAPGLYAMGLPFMRRRKSGAIHGADDDARELSAHLAACLARARHRHGSFA
ncbi:pyridine nucleotide-disulfide oxidoreductase [Billgrantia tianxiuensis]|uniref:Pyridine nucleotide-disulfide oxidoreductase n=1 Tax=Billgrantia tianxiuensis TaxID=2497861 RepID=A0A6I6SQL3_9GAMM|nr:NAD(P)-binding domain-containing protein [Halomonas tianxiuensis]MCE8032120.1 NAD(P)-binding domain-containing protein [Halomonas sp. MCCC 1A11057]QHC49847.1 pyridine nucleotide-disulfide oxidoreductase [Halomonas tianxiuensis]